MEDNLLEPFIYGVKEMMSTMLDIDCDPLSEVDSNLPTYISGIIHLSGEFKGQVALSFPAETAIKIVSEMAALEQSEVDSETLRDGVGEMVNIVAGHAKTMIASKGYNLTQGLPLIVAGYDHYVGLFKGEKHLVTMRTEFGDLILTLWLIQEDD